MNKNSKNVATVYTYTSNLGKIKIENNIKTFERFKLNVVADASVRPQTTDYRKLMSNKPTSNLKRPTSNSAITLIALIITIIVLLILAGVTLNMIMGENGIINKAQLAKEKNNEAQEKENENLKSLENSLDEIYRGNVTEMKMNCLWENPNSEVSFTEQTVELTEDITKYNFYEILYFDQTSEATNNEGCKSTGLIPTNEKVKI